MTFWTYMLRCADGSYYVGHSDELEARISQHQSGLIEGYTSTRLPVELVWSQEFTTRGEALDAERRIKGWSRAKKEALIRGDWDGVQVLSRKLFLRYGEAGSDVPRTSEAMSGGHGGLLTSTGSPAAPDQREEDETTPTPFALSRGVSEAEGPVSKGPSRRTAPPIIVLVRPQLGQNIGKAARAMLNFGLTELRLVAPRDGWPNPEAGPAASGADVVLEGARVFDTTAEAIADCGQVFASTVRRRDLVIPVVGPEEMAAAIHSSHGRTAILFGPERSGLETTDVALATHIVTVPINAEFGSLNLAQAVILLAYEWSRGRALFQPTLRDDGEPPAPMAEVESLFTRLDRDLDAVGYYFPPERAEASRLTIRTILTKPAWSSKEVGALHSVIRALSRKR